MCLWKAYGDPQVPPFPKDILPLVTPVMVPTTPVEITPPDAPVASTDPVPTTNALDLVQRETPCLPILASWDDFLLDTAVLFVESYIEDVGDIIDDIYLLFVEDNSSSLVAREHSDPQPLDISFEIDMIVETSLQQLEENSFTSEETYQSLKIVFKFPQTSYLLRILPTSWGAYSTTPMAPLLPTRRTVIQFSWCNFFSHQGASFMGVHLSLRGGYISSLPISSYKDDYLSLEFDSLSYMDMIPFLPPSFGHPPDGLVASTFIKDLSTYEHTLEATSITYYIWIPHPSSYSQWEVYLHLYLVYLLPKGRNVVCRHLILFCLNDILAGDYSIWGDTIMYFFIQGIYACTCMIYVILGGS